LANTNYVTSYMVSSRIARHELIDNRDRTAVIYTVF